jgi:hypothetical protein
MEARTLTDARTDPTDSHGRPARHRHGPSWAGHRWRTPLRHDAACGMPSDCPSCIHPHRDAITLPTSHTGRHEGQAAAREIPGTPITRSMRTDRIGSERITAAGSTWHCAAALAGNEADDSSRCSPSLAS